MVEIIRGGVTRNETVGDGDGTFMGGLCASGELAKSKKKYQGRQNQFVIQEKSK